MTIPLRLLALLLAASAGQAAQTSPATTPSAGDKTFRSEALHFTYSYPSTFIDAGAAAQVAVDEQKQKADATMKAAFNCISLPLSAARPGGNVIILIRADSACLHTSFTSDTLPDFTRGVVKGATSAVEGTTLSSPTIYSVANRPAAFMVGTMPLPNGITEKLAVTCVLTAPDIACWEFIAPNADELANLGLLTVKFDDALATAVLPPAMLKQP
jgi:hypothetical protein